MALIDYRRRRVCSQLKYHMKLLNCGNCDHSGEWLGDKGICTIISGYLFYVARTAICKFHSAFGGGNLRRGL